MSVVSAETSAHPDEGQLRAYGSHACTLLSQTLGVDLTLGDEEPEIEHGLAASIALTDVRHELALSLAVRVDVPAATAITTLMLGEPQDDADVVAELIGELANVIGGGLKTSLEGDGFRCTLGMPCHDPAAVTSATPRGRSRVFSMRCDDFSVQVLLVSRREPRVEICADRLVANMVLAEDLHDDAGTPILAAGTRLSKTGVRQIAERLPRRSVMVCMP